MSTPAAQVPAGRIAQLRQAYRMTKQTQPKIGLLLLGVFVLTAAATGAFGYFVFSTRWYFIILTVLSFIVILVSCLLKSAVFILHALFKSCTIFLKLIKQICI